MLNIRITTPIPSLEEYLDKVREHILESARKALADLATECDNLARNRGEQESFRNVTGNLRSSIGAVVYDHGVEYFSTPFAQVLGGSLGSAMGREAARSLAARYTDCICMVMVAGMDYAERVEQLSSKDVVESARIHAETVVQQRLEEAVMKAEDEIRTWRV